MGERIINPIQNIHTSKKYKEVIFINPYRFGNGVDPDAQAFITAAGISDTTQQNAIKQLVADLKGYSLWTNFIGLYPIVGGVASSHAVNLKSPGTYNLTISGSPTHDSTGIVWNTSLVQQASTNIQLNQTSVNNVSVGYYTPTVSTGPWKEIEAGSDTVLLNLHISYEGAVYSDIYNASSGRTSVAVATSKGLTSASRTASNSHVVYKNGAAIVTSTTDIGTPTLPTSTIIFNSTIKTDRTMSFGFVASGFNATESANVYAAIQAYQTTLGRQVT